MGRLVELVKKYAYDFGYNMENLYYYWFLMKKQQKQRNMDNGIKRDKAYDKKIKEYYADISGNSFHVDTRWHDFYAEKNGRADVRYIPENLYYGKIEPYFNKKMFAKALDDKCFYEIRLDTSLCRIPKIYVRNANGIYLDENFRLISREQAVQQCLCREFAMKYSLDGKGGYKITFSDGTLDEQRIGQLFTEYGSDFVVQEVLVQDGALYEINPSSVNTVRIMTMLMEDRVEVLSCVLRMGGIGARVDNYCSGGIICGITPEGRTKREAYDQKGNKYIDYHPNGNRFSDIEIPNIEQAKEMVKKQHMRLPYFRLISWDVVICEKEIGLIEYNITPQGISVHQLTNGPIFGDRTDEILKEGFAKKWKRK